MIEMVTYCLGSVTSAHARIRLLFDIHKISHWIWSKRICVNLRLNSIELWLLTYFESRIATTFLTPLHSKCIFVCMCVPLDICEYHEWNFLSQSTKCCWFFFIILSTNGNKNSSKLYTKMCDGMQILSREKKCRVNRVLVQSYTHIRTHSYTFVILSRYIPFRHVSLHSILVNALRTHNCSLWIVVFGLNR